MEEPVTILVIEDDVVDLTLTTEFLTTDGYTVRTARNGREGLELLGQDKDNIKLVILDWIMPVMNGIDLLLLIRRDNRYAQLPVIMVTSKTGSHEMLEGLTAGATYYLTKPISRDVLLFMVRTALERQKQLEIVTERAVKLVKGYSDQAVKFLKKEESMKFDLETYKAFNDFFVESLGCKDHTELVELLLNTVKKFEFSSAGKVGHDNHLRCSVLLASEQEVNLSDRGVLSKFDSLMLQRALETGEIIERGTFTTIPSKQRKTAILVRNTPSLKHEARKAAQIVGILLERFDERLEHFENVLDIMGKKQSLEKKNDQIKAVIRSCGGQLDHVNATYQQMKEFQMELMENMAKIITSRVEGLTEKQVAQTEGAVNEQLIKSMELYARDQITDQQFLLTIQKLKELIEEVPLVQGTLVPEQLGGTKQEAVDELLASLGL